MKYVINYTLIIAVFYLTSFSLPSLANPIAEEVDPAKNKSASVIEYSIDQETIISQEPSPYDPICVEARHTPYTCAQWQCMKRLFCIPAPEVCVMDKAKCRRRVAACEKRCGYNR